MTRALPLALALTLLPAGPVLAGPLAADRDEFIAAIADDEKRRVLGRIEARAPADGADAAALLDLFVRFPAPGVRRAVRASLERLGPEDAALEPAFLALLRREEPEARLLGIVGAERLRSAAALDEVRRLAAARFALPEPEGGLREQREAWAVQYEALDALARWEGEKALPLLLKKADQAPPVAGLAARRFWRAVWPALLKWAKSRSPRDLDKARAAAGAPIEPGEAKAAAADLEAAAADRSLDFETRRRLALKAGAVADDAGAEALVARHDAQTDGRERLLWAAAVFVSRRPAAVPLLARYSIESPDPRSRSGAFAQLTDMVGEARAKELVEAEKVRQKR